jgi:hypothetical protein
MISNFITPPDFVDDDQHTITIIDADPVDVETLAVYVPATMNLSTYTCTNPK